MRIGLTLAGFAILALTMKKRRGCASCSNGGWIDYVVTALGTAFYVSWALGVLSLPMKAAGILAHLALLTLLSDGCAICYSLWAVSCFMLSIEVSQKSNLLTGAFALSLFMPLGLIPIAAWKRRRERALESAAAAGGGKESIIAYVKDGCPFCEEFVRTYVPLVKRIRGNVEIRIVDKEAPAWINAFPTIVAVTANGKRLFTGLPDPQEFVEFLAGRHHGEKKNSKKVSGRIIAYLKQGDAASERFITDVAPRLKALVGDRNVFLLYQGLPAWVSKFPTVMLLGSRRKRVIEGVQNFREIEATL